MNHLDRITINPAQCGGRPCIRGMRIRWLGGHGHASTPVREVDLRESDDGSN